MSRATKSVQVEAEAVNRITVYLYWKFDVA